MRYLLLLICPTFVFGDALTYTTSSDDSCITEVPQSCESILGFPSFDPALGTLNSMTFTLTDHADIVWGFNDLFGGVGTEYSAQFTYDLSGNTPPLSYTASTQLDFIATGGPHDITDGPQFNEPYTFVESGAFPIGSNDVGTSGTGRILFFTGGVNGFNIGTDSLTNSAVLDVTYNYTATPEPRDGITVVAGTFLVLLLVRAKRAATVEAIPSYIPADEPPATFTKSIQ